MVLVFSVFQEASFGIFWGLRLDYSSI